MNIQYAEMYIASEVICSAVCSHLGYYTKFCMIGTSLLTEVTYGTQPILTRR
jgi:hypothetical protein